MKLILTVGSIVMMALLAQANPPNGYSKVPEERIEDYKKAFVSALSQNQKLIQYCNFNWVNQVLEYTDEVLVNNKSTTPLLKFNWHNGYTGTPYLHSLVVSTAADKKTLTQVVAEVYKMGETNSGDLANPVIVEDYILESQINCSAPAPHGQP